LKDNYLHSLVGRAVQVYRGGPDSNSGKLLDVSNDYLALQIEDGTVIYYKTSHLKSVQEDPQVIFSSVKSEADDSNESETLLKAGDFNELATQFLNQPVRINGSGPESREGTVIDVQGDFIILYTKEDGLLFYNNQHIKSLSVPIKEEKKEEEDTENEENSENEDDENGESNQEMSEQELMNTVLASYDQIAAESLSNLLMNLKYSWIKINRKGPESVEGLLIEIHDDHLVLAVDNQIFRIVLYHVKNFSVKINNSQNDTNQKSNTNSSNANNSNANSSNDSKSNDQNSNNQNSDKQNSNNKNNSNSDGKQSNSQRLNNQQEQKLKERAEYIERRKRLKINNQKKRR
jgi:spore coat protein B